jgi:hypothetical protein
MSGISNLREERIRSLAVRLKKNLLSSDELEQELSALSRSEQARLVEFLASFASGPIEVNSSCFEQPFF